MMISLFYLCFCCNLTISVLCLFFAVPWVRLLLVIVTCPGHTHLLFVGMHGNNSHVIKQVNNSIMLLKPFYIVI